MQLSVIRSEESQTVDISVCFTRPFRPIFPIFPLPTQKVDESTELGDLQQRWTWHASAHKDALSVAQDKVRGIWWEAARRRHPSPFEDKDSVSVARGNVREALAAILEKMGISEEERSVFLAYWGQVLPKTPAVKIHLARERELSLLLPPLKAEAKAKPVDVHRFYFRFCPTAETKGQPLSDYLGTLNPEKEIGKTAVLDFGGEVVNKEGRGCGLGGHTATPAINPVIQQFIEKHVVVHDDKNVVVPDDASLGG